MQPARPTDPQCGEVLTGPIMCPLTPQQSGIVQVAVDQDHLVLHSTLENSTLAGRAIILGQRPETFFYNLSRYNVITYVTRASAFTHLDDYEYHTLFPWGHITTNDSDFESYILMLQPRCSAPGTTEALLHTHRIGVRACRGHRYVVHALSGVLLSQWEVPLVSSPPTHEQPFWGFEDDTTPPHNVA